MGERIAWLLVGAVAFYALAPAAEPVVYSEVVVPAPRIIEREPPAREPTIIERIRFVAAAPTVVATAPQGAVLEVSSFCRPTVLRELGDTTTAVPAEELLLRSVVFDEAPIWKPFSSDRLFLSAVSSYGDLSARDYRTRGSWDARALENDVRVRYGRAAMLRDLWEGGAQVWTLFSVINLGWELMK